jgi:hypothetical protein
MRDGLAHGMFPLAGDSPEAWLAALTEYRRQGGTREQHLKNEAWLRISYYATKDVARLSLHRHHRIETPSTGAG